MSLLIGLRNNSPDGHCRTHRIMMKPNKNTNDALIDVSTLSSVAKSPPSVPFTSLW